MEQWLADAKMILEVASASWDSTASEMVIIRDRQGGLLIRDGAGWSLLGLQAAFGAKAVYRITRNPRHLRLEVLAGSRFRQFDLDAPVSAPRTPRLNPPASHRARPTPTRCVHSASHSAE